MNLDGSGREMIYTGESRINPRFALDIASEKDLLDQL